MSDLRPVNHNATLALTYLEKVMNRDYHGVYDCHVRFGESPDTAHAMTVDSLRAEFPSVAWTFQDGHVILTK